MCSGEAATGVEQPTDDGGRDAIRRVGDHVEWSAGQPEIGDVGSDDGDALTESRFELVGATWMELEGDHPRSRGEQRLGDRSGTGADVEDECARRESCISDEALRCLRIELVEAPAMP